MPMWEQILLTVGVTVLAVLLLFFLLRNRIATYFINLTSRVSEANLYKLEERNSQLLRHEQQLSEEKMKRNEQALENKKDLIKELVENIRGEIDKSNLRLEETEKTRVGEFAKFATLLEENKEIARELRASTEGLKNILSNNQLRGAYGEEVAENILRMLGFQRELDYVVNTRQEQNINRPDLSIKLPDGSKVNVDVKFPYQSLVRFQSAEKKEEKKAHLAQFSRDVKDKIKQVTTREYINPEEKTLDFVVLFVPNEMVFSVICDQLSEVTEEAMRRKVIIAGPFSFAAIMRMIRQSYDNFRVQEDLHRLVGLIGKFKSEFANYNTELDKLGDRIKSLSTQYEKVSMTRTKQLNRVIDKIESEREEHLSLADKGGAISDLT